MPKNCPQCGKATARASALHASDGLSRVLFYSPYRCRECRLRFWQVNLLKPVLLFTVVAIALFVGWWMPKEERATAALTSNENYAQIAARAARGDAEAELMMGMRYADGNGVIKDEKEAARWLEKAAHHGKAEAQYRYGLALLEGRGVEQDYKAAFHWIEEPAKRGHSYAQYSLGELYRYGTGTTMDKAQAYLWFNLAAAQGVEKAAKARDSLVWQLKPEQITAMQEAAHTISKGQKQPVAPAVGIVSPPPPTPAPK